MVEKRGPEDGRAMLRRSFSLELDHLWLAVPFLLVVWISSAVPLPALDFWWHLKAAQIILETGSIPATDIFSYTSAGKTYILQNWLGEIAFYLVYRAGGPALVIFFNTLLLLAALVPVYLLCLQSAESRRTGVLTSCLAAIPLAFQGNIRPQVFSFVVFAWFYFILVRHRKGASHALWLLPLLMAFWVNLHGGFVLGLALLLFFLGLDLLDALLKRGRHPHLSRLIVVTLLTAAATLLNPQLAGVYRYVAGVAADPVSLRYVVEWQAPQIGNVADILRFFGPFFLGLFILIRSDKRASWEELALFMALAFFGFTARRNAAWFALVGAPILARHISLPSHVRLRSLEGGLTRRLNLLIAVLLLAATVLGLPWLERLRSSQDADLLLLEPRLPVRAADFLLTKRLEGRIFHPQHYGDYLIWRLWPHQLTFFDGRVHLFPMQVAEDYFTIQRGGAGWEETAGKYGIQYLLLDRNDEDQSGLLKFARDSDNWRVLYEDGRSVLFTRQIDGKTECVTN